MKNNVLILFSAFILLQACSSSGHKNTSMPHEGPVTNKKIAMQRQMLAKNTKGKGFGPQSPRDIDSNMGRNDRAFNTAPAFTEMNLCNIHFHKNAEHKGGEFTKYAGNGDGHGYQSGFVYSGRLSKTELAPFHQQGLSTGNTVVFLLVIRLRCTTCIQPHKSSQVQRSVPV